MNLRSHSSSLLLLLLLFGACATTPRRELADGLPIRPAPAEPTVATAPGESTSPEVARPVPFAAAASGSRWRLGEALLQGYFGAVLYEGERSGGSRPSVGMDYDEMQLPTLGGGGQWKLAGEHVDFGLEGMLAFNWRAGASAYVVGGGGATVAVDVDLFVFDLYGGPFASVFLGDRVRAYASAGPLMQWAQYEESSLTGDGSSSGFGLGVYARAGLEFAVSPNSLVGFGVRWSDAEVDLGGDSGDLDVSGIQLAVTFSQFY